MSVSLAALQNRGPPAAPYFLLTSHACGGLDVWARGQHAARSQSWLTQPDQNVQHKLGLGSDLGRPGVQEGWLVLAMLGVQGQALPPCWRLMHSHGGSCCC